MKCKNINFIVALNFDKNCICDILYMIVSHYKNKTLNNRMIFGTKFPDLWMFIAYTELIRSLIMQIMLLVSY